MTTNVFWKILPKALCLLFWFGIPTIVMGSQFHYVFPQNIFLALEEKAGDKKNTRELIGTIESKLGTLQKLNLFFNSSPDLKIECAITNIDRMSAGEIKKIQIKLFSSNGKPDEMGSWVKMSAKFLPDYGKILETVSNVASYPVEYERQRLIDTATANQKSRDQSIEATRLFLNQAQGGKP